MIPRLVATPLPEQRADRTAPETAGLCPRGPARAWPSSAPVSPGAGGGETGFPRTPARGRVWESPAFPESTGCSSRRVRCGETGFPRTPVRGRGWEGCALPPGGEWGNQVSPFPCVRARPSRRLEYGGTWFPQFHVSPTEPGTVQDGTSHPSSYPPMCSTRTCGILNAGLSVGSWN